MSINDKPTGTWRCRACGSTWAGQQLYADPTPRHLSAWTCGNLQCGGVCDHLYATHPDHQTKKHLYRLLRPAAIIDCYPECDTDGHSLTPTVIETHWPPVRTPDGRFHYATVAYAEPLTFDQIWHYDLQPVDAVEAARYFVWHYYGRDQEVADAYLYRWMLLSSDEIRAILDRDDDLITRAVLVLRAVQESQP